MGYDLRFEGRFTLEPALTPARRAYLEAFSRTWRWPRDTARLPASEPLREAVGLPLGPEGAFFVGGAAHTGDRREDASVLDSQRPPEGQPGLRCCWRPSADGRFLEWDGCEKFPAWREWLGYLITAFLEPWGHSLEGVVHWEGEDGASGTLRASGGHLAEEPSPEQELDEEVRYWMTSLESQDLELRLEAAAKLYMVEGADEQTQRAAVAALSKALEPPELAKAVLETLGDLGSVAAPAVPFVIPLLRSSDPQLRYWATYALGRMGPEARVALPELQRLQNDPEYGPKYGAIDAIQRLS